MEPITEIVEDKTVARYDEEAGMWRAERTVVEQTFTTITTDMGSAPTAAELKAQLHAENPDLAIYVRGDDRQRAIDEQAGAEG